MSAQEPVAVSETVQMGEAPSGGGGLFRTPVRPRPPPNGRRPSARCRSMPRTAGGLEPGDDICAADIGFGHGVVTRESHTPLTQVCTSALQ